MLGEFLLVASRQRIAFDESLGQSNHTDLEALRRLGRSGRAERDLCAPAPDVDHDRSCAADIHPVDGRQVNQARFLRAGDDSRTNASLRFDAGEELAAVTRLT